MATKTKKKKHQIQPEPKKASKPRVIRHNVPRGDLVVYKAVVAKYRNTQTGNVVSGKAIAVLIIPKHASAIKPDNIKKLKGKCRASEAIVARVEHTHNYSYSKQSDYEYVEGSLTSGWDRLFSYKVGEIVKPVVEFSKQKQKTCTSGIHFFLTRLEAEQY